MRTGHWTLAPQGTLRFCNAKGNCFRCSGVGKTGPPPCWQPACLPPGLGGSVAVFLRVWAQSGKLPSRARQNQATGILREQAQSSEREKELTSGKPGIFRARVPISPGWERTPDHLSSAKFTGCVLAPRYLDLSDFCPLTPLPGPGICLVPVPRKTHATHRLCPLPGLLQPLSTGSIP